jgi:uroporphyrinogen decarboxylase
MTSKERILAAVRGEKVDRVPFSVWYHFRFDPPAGPKSKMAEAELDFHRRYQPDLLKVMHDVEYEPVGPIASTSDWANLPVLNPQVDNFGMQLHTLRNIRAGLGADVAMIDTVFSVYHYADKISRGRLRDDLRDDSESVHVGLRAITDSLARYAKACIDSAGCDGIYYALSGASDEGVSAQDYKKHFLAYDLEVLQAVHDAEFNVLHMHGYKGLQFEIANELPAHAVCWSDRAGGPSLAEARKVYSGCIMGGIDEQKFGVMTPDEIEAQAREAIAVAGPKFILSPGCSVPENSASERMLAIAKAVS